MTKYKRSFVIRRSDFRRPRKQDPNYIVIYASETKSVCFDTTAEVRKFQQELEDEWKQMGKEERWDIRDFGRAFRLRR